MAYVFVVLIMFALSTAALTAASFTVRYASYELTYTQDGTTHSVLLNESVSPTSNPNLSILSIVLQSNMWNLSYSQAVNSSEAFFPYVPSISNRSFYYSTPQYALSFTLEDQGPVNIQYLGQTYKGTIYGFTGDAKVNQSTYSLSGNLTVFPSSLLFSLIVELNATATISAKLVSTNLQLSAADPRASYALVAVTAGVGVAAVLIMGLGLPFLSNRRRSAAQAPTQPKDYWVD